jgi:hypothetical protein
MPRLAGVAFSFFWGEGGDAEVCRVEGGGLARHEGVDLAD